jgi:putative Mg2+ transporter-C (MgtC) family protein
MLDALLAEVAASVPTVELAVRVLWRLGFAAILGGVIGWERQSEDKPAGLRTHVLVSVGAATFVVVSLEAQMPIDALSRVIQGVATGIGFIGAGAILKRESAHRVEGLTTAATIWMATAIGVAAGLGRVAIALVAMAFALGVLTVLRTPAAQRAPSRGSDHPVNARE